MGVVQTTRIDLYRRFRPTPSQLRFQRSDAFGRLFSSGYGCLGRGTPIYDPVSGETLPVEELRAPGHVETLDGPMPRTASFLKGTDEMYAVTIGGQTVSMTADHKMLTPEGWVSLRGLGIGALVACSSPSGGPRSTRTAPGFPGCCSQDCRRCDGPPRAGTARVRSSLPSPNDALARTRCCFCGDVMEGGQGRTHSCPGCDHPSSPGDALPGGAPSWRPGSPLYDADAQALTRTRQGRERSPSASSRTRFSGPRPTPGRCGCTGSCACPSVSRSLEPAAAREYVSISLACLAKPRAPAPSTSGSDPIPAGAETPRAEWACIEDVAPLGLQEVWDLHVPTVHHYIARGIVHANSGKSKTGCREGIIWAVQYAGSRGLIGRLTATDLRDTTMVTFWREMGQIGFIGGDLAAVRAGRAHYTHNKADREVVFWNGSSIIYRHLDDPEALGSLELNWAFIDEGAEVDDMIYKTISSSRLRWHLPVCDQQERVEELIASGAGDEEIAAVECSCPRGMWVCTNPGASGYLRQVVAGKADGWDWIPAKPGDNPYNGPDYYAKMERDRQMNGDVWMRKFYNGDWTAFEGQRFTMFDSERHILDVPWRPTEHHMIVEGWDFGHRETFVTWMAYHPRLNEPVVVFADLQVNEVQEAADVASAVKRIRAEYRINERNLMVLGDPAGTGASQFSAVSPIGAYDALGIHIAPARWAKNPQARADLLTAFLNESRVQSDGSIWPGIVFSPACRAVIDSVLSVQWKKQTSRAGEDPRETFLKKDDHGFDSLSYGLSGVPEPVFEVPKPRRMGRNQTIQDVLAADGF